jgi:hypothetical protein
MPFRPPRPWSVLASMLAAGLILAVTGCGATPLGPTPPRSRQLGSPIVLQAMRSQPPTAAGQCPAGWVALSIAGTAETCYSKLGAPLTITSAAVSPVTVPPHGPGSAAYGFVVAVPAAEVAAVTALITQAYNSRGALGISVAGKIWNAPQVIQPFPGRQLEIALASRKQALQLHHILVPSG